MGIETPTDLGYDHPLLYGNNGSLDTSTNGIIFHLHLVFPEIRGPVSLPIR